MLSVPVVDKLPVSKGDGRFQLTRYVGEGGFGVVYEAFDRKRNAVVALKALRRFDAAALYRFKQEFHSIVDLNHPHIVSLYELFSPGQEWYFTMEFVDGVPFTQYVRRDHNRLDADRLRHVLSQVSDALCSIHQRGILHRDIKPSNVLVTAESRAVVLDFGLATELAGGDDL